MPSAFCFRNAVAEVTGDVGMADTVMDRLIQPDALAALAETVHDMIVGPILANDLGYREGVDDRMGSRDEAAVIVSAIANAFRPGDVALPPPDVLRRQVDALRYKDWCFDLTSSGGRPAVRVLAIVENAYDSTRTVTTSRVVPIDRTVVEAALHGVLSLEEHEARERLSLDGQRVLSPHIPPADPR